MVNQWKTGKITIVSIEMLKKKLPYHGFNEKPYAIENREFLLLVYIEKMVDI